MMTPMEVRRRALGSDSKTWLYKNGSQYPGRTAGWDNTLDDDGNIGSFFLRDNCLELKNKSTENLNNPRRVGVVTQQAISFSGYSRLCMEFSSNTTTGKALLRLALYTSANRQVTAYSYSTQAYHAELVDVRQILVLDISDLQEKSLFVGAVWALAGGVDIDATAYIHSIWME